MSFTISVSPDHLQPAYNDLTYRVYSTDYTLTDFRYNFYTYVGATLVNTTKLYPRPDGYCNFNPSIILRQYISRYYQPTLATYSEANTAEIIDYKVVMKYEYMTASVITEFSGDTGTTKYIWNGVAQYLPAMDISTFVDDYIPATTSQAKALNFINEGTATNGIKLYLADKKNISFFRKNLSGTAVPSFIKFTVYCSDGAFKQFTYNLNASTSGAISYINHFPIGISELNSITWSSTAIPGGKSSYITLTEDVRMEVVLLDTNSDTVSKTYYFTFYEEPCKYDRYYVAYQTSAGGYGYIDFNRKHYENISSEKVVYDKILPYNYTTSDRVSTVYGNLAAGSITLNTDWIYTQGIIDEIADMVVSPELYLVDANNISIPIFIEKSDFNKPLISQDNMVQFTFTFKEAFKRNTIN